MNTEIKKWIDEKWRYLFFCSKDQEIRIRKFVEDLVSQTEALFTDKCPRCSRYFVEETILPNGELGRDTSAQNLQFLSERAEVRTYYTDDKFVVEAFIAKPDNEPVYIANARARELPKALFMAKAQIEELYTSATGDAIQWS